MCHVKHMTKANLTANKKTITALNENLGKALSLNDLCNITESNDSHITLDDKTYNTPVRLGKVLDDITRLHRSPKKKQKLIQFGAAELNTNQFTFKRLDESTVPLTEKEAEILIYLYENKPNKITRNTLLKRVWGYADSIETHTLETHIYRLRQKIEINPANPQILLTGDNGYTVL